MKTEILKIASEGGGWEEWHFPQCWLGESEFRFEKLKRVLTSVFAFALVVLLKLTPLGWRQSFEGILLLRGDTDKKRWEQVLVHALPRFWHHEEHSPPQMMVPHYSQSSLNLCKAIVSYKIFLWPLAIFPRNTESISSFGAAAFHQ